MKQNNKSRQDKKGRQDKLIQDERWQGEASDNKKTTQENGNVEKASKKWEDKIGE